MWNTENEEIQSIDSILSRDQRTTSHRVLDHNAQRSWLPLLEKFQMLRRRQDDDMNRHIEMTNARTELNDRAQRRLQDNSHLRLVGCDNRGVRSRSNAPVKVLTWLSKSKWLIIYVSHHHTFFINFKHISSKYAYSLMIVAYSLMTDQFDMANAILIPFLVIID